jgi:eukaryotic-like serine/threonine-protein kinase
MMKGLANVGDVLAGKYRVDKILGIGGMGMVVAATHLELDQQVAVKFMLPAAMESPEASARFLREARAAGKLTSEHICRVIDVGRFESGAPYIVMEYLEGYDLGTMLKRRGPLRVAACVDYILQACEGLAEAHAQGIVHRDLKPDNLFLSARADGGHVIKVLDFGISKAAVTGIQTQTGDILGSPAYMAPEQMRSTKDVDARADVWSLGMVMYQLLTGRLPFTGDSLPNLCLSVMNDLPVPPNQLREDLPDGMSAAILRCLEKDRDDRFADVGELAAALGPFATPAGFGSVTRVQSALRGRQAPPDPSQTVPHGFAAQGPLADGPVPQGLVPPTLQGTGGALGAGSDLFAPKLASAPWAPEAPVGEERPVGVTTVGASSGESYEMTAVSRRRGAAFPIGLVGGLCGAIGLVVVLIVMVLRSGGGGGGAAPAGTAPQEAATQPAGDPPRPPPPKVTPIDDPDESVDEPVGTEPVGTGPVDSADGEDRVADQGARPKGPRGRRPPKGTGKGAAKGPGRAGGSADDDDGSDVTVVDDPPPPSTTDAGISDEDKWGRMHHDKPKDPPKAPAKDTTP